MLRLEFTQAHTYPNDEDGVTLPVVLRSGASQVDVVASIDTGASFCLFAAEIAERLGIDLRSGERKRFRTANSSLETFGHEVEITTTGVVTHSMVYFFADPLMIKNVLGRVGWLDRVQFGLIDHDSTIYLAPYDQS